MSLHGLKIAVTRFFKRRVDALGTMQRRGLGRDDFLELYVLARMIRAAPARPRFHATERRAGRDVFVVAASPSPRWHGASYIEIPFDSDPVFVRTGLEVLCADKATCEVDVGVFHAYAATWEETVPAWLVLAAIEAKHHRTRASLTIANQVIGKIARMQAGIRNARRREAARRLGGAPRHALVTVVGASDNARIALEYRGCRTFEVTSAALTGRLRDEFSTWLRDLFAKLGTHTSGRR